MRVVSQLCTLFETQAVAFAVGKPCDSAVHALPRSLETAFGNVSVSLALVVTILASIQDVPSSWLIEFPSSFLH